MTPKGVIRMTSGETPPSVGDELASAPKIEPVAKPENAPNATPAAGTNIISVIWILFRKMPF
jgi:hypothetical protein